MNVLEKHPKAHVSILLLMTFLAMGLVACGSNALKSLDEPEPDEEATLNMEDGKPDSAIKVLESALASDSANYQYISLLSAAYAQKFGVDTLTFAEKLGTNATSSSGATSGNASVITAMYPILPAATDANIAGISYASALLVSIPASNRTSADNFKLALLSTAETSIRTKKLDRNGDGILSIDEIGTLDTSNAAGILSAITNAASAVVLAQAAGFSAEEATAAVTQIQSILATQPGATDEEKLQNYLRTTQSG